MYSNRGLLETNPAMAWIIIIVALAVVVFFIAAMWKTFTKAGKPGWAAIVPIYNYIVLSEVAGKPIWMGLGMALGGMIPVVGIFVSLAFGIIIGIGVAEKFGKSQGFGVGLGLLGFVFYPIIGFGDAQYEGATAEDINDEVLDA